MDDEPRFSIIPIDLLTDHRLTLIETRVVAAILSFRNKNTNVSFPSRNKISERCGYAIGTVSNATKTLVEKGWLKKTKVVFNGSNTYEVIVPDESHRSSDTHRSSEPHRTSDIESHRSGDIESHRSSDTNRPLTNHITNHITCGDSPNRPPACPQKAILDLYHRILPELTRHTQWTAARQKTLQARWREKPKRQTLEFWEGFFNHIRQSPFLMGKVAPRHGDKPFTADLEWMIKPANFAKIVEGKYHQ